MERKVKINFFKWSARLLTIIPLYATLFITFEDVPYYFPWDEGFPGFTWTLMIYFALIFLLLAWFWGGLGLISALLFVIAFIGVAISKGLYPIGLFICCIPGALFFILSANKKYSKKQLA